MVTSIDPALFRDLTHSLIHWNTGLIYFQRIDFKSQNKYKNIIYYVTN